MNTANPELLLRASTIASRSRSNMRARFGSPVSASVKAISVDGVMPSKQTVLKNKYPITRPLFMYTDGEPASGTPLAAFVGLCSTADGKKIVGEQGYVPLQ